MRIPLTDRLLSGCHITHTGWKQTELGCITRQEIDMLHVIQKENEMQKEMYVWRVIQKNIEGWDACKREVKIGHVLQKEIEVWPVIHMKSVAWPSIQMSNEVWPEITDEQWSVTCNTDGKEVWPVIRIGIEVWPEIQRSEVYPVIQMGIEVWIVIQMRSEMWPVIQRSAVYPVLQLGSEVWSARLMGNGSVTCNREEDLGLTQAGTGWKFIQRENKNYSNRHEIPQVKGGETTQGALWQGDQLSMESHQDVDHWNCLTLDEDN